MRRGSFSPLAITVALLMATTAVHAETFDLFGLLRPRPAAEPAATPDEAGTPAPRPAGGADTAAGDIAPLPQPQMLAAAPLPQPRPASASAQAAATATTAIAPLPQPQMLAAVPLPPHRPRMSSEPSLLLLQIPSSGKQAVAAVAQTPAPAQPAAAAPAVEAQAPALVQPALVQPAPAQPTAAQPAPATVQAAAPPAPATPVAPPAPVAPAAPVVAAAADTLVPPVEHAAIPFPVPRPAVAQAPGVQPKPVRTVTIAAVPDRRTVGAAPAPVAVAAAAAPREAPTPRAIPAPAAHPVPPAAPPAPVDVSRDLASDPMPVVSLEPTASTLTPEAMSAIVIAQTEREGLTATQDLAIAKAAGAQQNISQEASRMARDEAPAPALPPDPAAVADAMLQRIPTVTSAIAGIVSAVSPTSAYAGANPTQMAQATANAPAGQAQAAAPPDVTRVERPAGGPAPYEMVRRLQRLQDRIANGDTDALQAQRVLIAQTEEVFRNTDPQVWQDPRNARGAVIFFLSGGAPTELHRLLTITPRPAVDERLLQGALAYVEGRQDDAERYLSEINAMQLPDALGGQIAMAQAAVTVSKDPRKAMALLDVARLMMPGTLVEEAALRREILVAAQLGDLKQFEQLARQYLFRFRHSVYAGNFRQRFAAALTRMAFVNDADQFHRLSTLLAPLDRDSRLEIYLMVARGALNQGKLVAATMASDKVIAEAPALSSDAERARVYRSAVRAASSQEVDVALAELKGAVRSRLPPEDVLLLNAAITTAELVKSAGETVKVAATKAVAKPDPMKITAPAGNAPALVPRWPAAEPAARVAEAKPTDQQAPSAPPAAPAGGSVQAAVQPAAVQPAAAPQPAAAAAPAPMFDDGSTANALVSRAQGTLTNVDALLKDAPK